MKAGVSAPADRRVMPQDAVSIPDKSSETSNHQRKGGKPAAKQCFVLGEGEGVVQIRCSKLIVYDQFEMLVQN